MVEFASFLVSDNNMRIFRRVIMHIQTSKKPLKIYNLTKGFDELGIRKRKMCAKCTKTKWEEEVNEKKDFSSFTCIYNGIIPCRMRFRF